MLLQSQLKTLTAAPSQQTLAIVVMAALPQSGLTKLIQGFLIMSPLLDGVLTLGVITLGAVVLLLVSQDSLDCIAKITLAKI